MAAEVHYVCKSGSVHSRRSNQASRQLTAPIVSPTTQKYLLSGRENTMRDLAEADVQHVDVVVEKYKNIPNEVLRYTTKTVCTWMTDRLKFMDSNSTTIVIFVSVTLATTLCGQPIATLRYLYWFAFATCNIQQPWQTISHSSSTIRKLLSMSLTTIRRLHFLRKFSCTLTKLCGSYVFDSMLYRAVTSAILLVLLPISERTHCACK